MCSIKILVSLCLFVQAAIESSKAYPVRTPLDCVAFLARYGYLEANPRSKLAVPAGEALKMYQKLMSLPETGLPDTTTMEKMNKRRCGNPDIIPGLVRNDGNDKRKKRYALIGPYYKWRSPVVTYGISQHSTDSRLRRAIIEDQIDKTFLQWQAVTNIQFRRSNSKPDIDIKFVKQNHDDNRSFDGPGEILAHAFPPGRGIGGDVHFDDEERWDVISDSGNANFPWVALHEIGHALGLGHSSKPGSIMLPVEEEFNANLKLHDDDIRGIQAIYGKTELDSRGEKEPQSEIVESIPIDFNAISAKTRPDLCKNDTIDAITMLQNGQVFAFSGHYAIRLELKGDKVVKDIARIEHVFPGVTEHHIDAAVTTQDGSTFILKGKRIWRLRNFVLEEDQSVPQVFRGIHADLDAAFRLGKQMYFIQRNNVIIREEGSSMNSHVGKLSQMNIPDHRITAAFDTPSGEVYMFHNDRFWTPKKAADGTLKVQTAKPKNTRTQFLRC